MAPTNNKKDAATIVYILVWLFLSIFYFYECVLQSAPTAMLRQLAHTLHVMPLAFDSLYGLFFYGYALFCLIVGLALDQFGPRRVVPIGAVVLGSGALLFASGELMQTGIGRFLQGAGGAFAIVGAVYLATTRFPADRRATLVGITQMFGVSGAFTGQFLIGPAITAGLAWNGFWSLMGLVGATMAVLLFVAIPAPGGTVPRVWASNMWAALGAVLRNPQSILCGVIAGLFFLPTSLFDMIWGVRYLQEARNLSHDEAVMRSATVLLGWIVGCPLLGFVSDRIGRRKPVIILGGTYLFGCAALVLYEKLNTSPGLLGLLIGIASGAAMIPYTVIKEVNRPEHSGTAIGVLNFINFGLSAILGPAFGILLTKVGSGGMPSLIHYQVAFTPIVYGVGLAVFLALFLRETGPAPRPLKPRLFKYTRL